MDDFLQAGEKFKKNLLTSAEVRDIIHWCMRRIYLGVWHRLVVRLVRDQEAAGSNPVTPTKSEKSLKTQRVFRFFSILCCVLGF